MRVLLDENLPHDLAGLLTTHSVDTVAGRNWKGILNGTLLTLVGQDYDAFLTMDRRLPNQQEIARLPFAVVLLLAPSNRLVHLRPLLAEVLQVLPAVKPGALYTVGA